ncbi:MAG: hypothetical protein KDD44_13705, partial [Bdellovibrionales bacterium]|nr:hypothetical protein [Bdellovibrionales bacterium]
MTHSRLPSSEDPLRSVRPEFLIYERLCSDHSIPLHSIDSRRDASVLAPLEPPLIFDFLVSVSWRFLVPERVYSRARIAAFNVHRGKLPQYAGAEPVLRALEAGEDT